MSFPFAIRDALAEHLADPGEVEVEAYNSDGVPALYVDDLRDGRAYLLRIASDGAIENRKGIPVEVPGFADYMSERFPDYMTSAQRDAVLKRLEPLHTEGIG